MNALDPRTEARAFRCDGCGGPVAITAPGRSVTCPHCRRVLAVPQAFVAEIQGYRDAIARNTRREEAAGADIAPLAPGVVRSLLVWLVVLLVAVPAATGGALVAFQSEVDPAGGAGFAAMLVAGVMVVLFARAHDRRRGVARPLAPSRIACPYCGAPNEHLVGTAAERCRHCRVALAPSRAAVAADLAMTSRLAEEAEQDRVRRERSYVGCSPMPWRGYSPVAAFILFVAALLVLVDVLALFVPEVGTPEWGGAASLVGVGMGLAAVVINVRATRRAEAYAALLQRLTTGLGGTRLGAEVGAVAWLNTLWPGLFPIEYLGAGPHFAAVSAFVNDFPVLIVFDPVEPLNADGVYAKVVLAMAVAFATTVPSPGSDVLVSARGTGFSLARYTNGLIAVADSSVVKAAASGVDIAPLITAALHRMAQLARTIHGTPGGRASAPAARR